MLVPDLLLVHSLDNTGNGFPELFDSLLDFSGVLIELFFEGEFDSVDATFDTGVDFIFDLLVDIGFFPRLLGKVLLVDLKAIDEDFVFYWFVEVVAELFDVVLRVGLKEYWSL